MYSVLIVGLQRPARHRLAEVIEHLGLTARTAATVADARAMMRDYVMTAVMIDCGVDDASGLQAVATLPLKPHQTVIFLTDRADGPLANTLKSTDASMFELLPREPDQAELERVFKSIKRAAMGRHARGSDSPRKFESMLGNSPAMLEVYNMIAKVAPTDASVLISGESGTGKELVASAIHERSDRSDKPFVAVNCGAIAENLIESELFGHHKGAFTGADKAHAGVFEQADGGTLFLDEITEMPLEVQVRFLRVLESGTLRRLGAEKDTRVDVRVVAATNRDPREQVDCGEFREDLLYRLAVFPISLPRLQERGDDVVLLASHFLSQHNREQKTEKRLTDLAQRRLRRYEWPGNVRQLRNIVQRAYILESAEINLDCLDDLLDDCEAEATNEAAPLGSATAPADDAPVPEHLAAATADPDAVVQVEVGTTIDEAEKRLILTTLDELDGNKTEAARVLGISVKTLYNRLNEYESG